MSLTHTQSFRFRTEDDDDDEEEEDEEEEPINVRHKGRNTDGANNKESDLLLEPKSEYEDGNDEPVEDLTMADDEIMDDLDQAGPSHGGEGSSQGTMTHTHCNVCAMPPSTSPILAIVL